jgi:hypothetical protein
LSISFIALPDPSTPTRRKAEKMTAKTKNELATEAADLMGDVLVTLQRLTGLPTECLLAGAHAQIVATMAASLGGPKAAQMIRSAADHVEHQPSLHAAALAFARPAGRA